jgi:site-specific DNA-cytosine methylase
MKLLEIFKGTGSVGKVAVKMNFSVVSIDFDPIFTPTIETDILLWDYKKFYKDTGYTPDFIWASPPCNTYSPLVYPLKERDVKTAKPFSERAKIGTAILYRTLEIISFFNSKNKHMGFCIENPRGMMRKDAKMKKLHMETTYYCLYGDTKRKPTDFWSNFKTDLKTTDEGNKALSCKNTLGVVNIPLKDRYSIPGLLIRHILNMYKKSLKENKKFHKKNNSV